MGKSYACRDKKENQLRKGDFYPTPMSLIWSAKKNFNEWIPTDRVITEPCCGNGLITKALKKIGYQTVIENDLINDRKDILHNDIMGSDLDEWCSKNIITNFPFSAWDSCVLSCLAVEGIETVITIGRLNYLSTESRLLSGLWDYLKEVWIFSRYIDYRTEERVDGQFNVGAMATGWFVFSKKKTENKSPLIKFIDVQEYATLGNKEDD